MYNMARCIRDIFNLKCLRYIRGVDVEPFGIVGTWVLMKGVPYQREFI